MAGTPVPFPYISELPERAQFEIERDFLHIQKEITDAAGVYDAVVDPTLAADDPGTRTFTTIFKAVEALSALGFTTCSIGVRPTATAITETGSLAAGVNIVRVECIADSLAQAGSGGASGLPEWNIGAHNDSSLVGRWSLSGLAVETSLTSGGPFTATATIVGGTNCRFAGTTGSTQIASGSGSAVWLNSCTVYNLQVCNTLYATNTSFFYDGGSTAMWGGHVYCQDCELVLGNGVTLTCNTTEYVIWTGHYTYNTEWNDVGSSSQTFGTVSIGTFGPVDAVYWNNRPPTIVGTASQLLSLNISDTVAWLVVIGTYHTLTTSGTPSAGRPALIEAQCDTVDLTGPATLSLAAGRNGVVSTPVTLRGAGFNGDIVAMAQSGGSTPVFSAVSMSRSVLTMSLRDASGGGGGTMTQYLIDVGSTHNIIVLESDDFDGAGTNNSTTTLIIDDTFAGGLPALADDKVWIGVAGVATAAVLSGDVTMTNAGVVTVTNLAEMETDITNLETASTATDATVAEIETDLGEKADLASPALTGHPTGVTESPGDNSTRLSTTAYADAAVAVVNALVTEIETDLGETIPISQGGTGQTTALAARGSSGLNIEGITLMVNAAFAMAATDRNIYTSVTLTATRSVTLCAASAVNAGTIITIADAFGAVNGAHWLQVVAGGTDTIAGAGIVMITAKQQVILQSDGVSNWLQLLPLTLPIAQGGTGQPSASSALAALGGAPAHIFTVCTSGTRPGSPSIGDTILETDTGNELMWYGTTPAWQRPWNQPWGNVAEAKTSGNQTGITTEVDLTSLTVTFTAIANRKYRVSCSVATTQVTTNGRQQIKISTAATGAGTIIAASATVPSPLDFDQHTIIAPLQTPAAGSTSYHLRGLTAAGTMSINNSLPGPSTITVDDVGPNGAPS